MSLSEVNGRPPRVLIVDDEYGVREGCRRVLASEGMVAETAEHAGRGLELLAQQPYDLVFVDLKMPGMDGLEFLSAAEPYRESTVFVVITGYATLEMAVDATKRGAHLFLAKPFAPDELLGVTWTALAHGQVVQERNRLQAERAVRLLELATEKGRLRSVLASMSDGVIVTNRDGQVVLTNAAALWAVAGDPAAGPGCVSECVQSPELVALMCETLCGGEPRWIVREINADETGERVMAASVSPVVDENGECLGTVTVLHDVSELKRVEHVKAQFVNMVAHELRSPLAAIDSHVNLLRLGMVEDREQEQHMLERAHSRLQALLSLVGDLLTVTRMDAGTREREVLPVDLGEVATEVGELLAPLAAEGGVDLSVSLERPGVTAEADRDEMVALVTNLASNAIKYNRSGGAAAIRVTGEGPWAELKVSDTGLGISEEGRQRIFEEFYRERTAQTRAVTGTGLGLAIVRRIVETCHGTVSVESTLGAGSVFTIRLPARQGGGAEPPVPGSEG
jgi:two-component system, OmpR family, phosphate regulon sensor histidine kinase PhoR